MKISPRLPNSINTAYQGLYVAFATYKHWPTVSEVLLQDIDSLAKHPSSLQSIAFLTIFHQGVNIQNWLRVGVMNGNKWSHFWLIPAVSRKGRIIQAGFVSFPTKPPLSQYARDWECWGNLMRYVLSSEENMPQGMTLWVDNVRIAALLIVVLF